MEYKTELLKEIETQLFKYIPGLTTAQRLAIEDILKHLDKK